VQESFFFFVVFCSFKFFDQSRWPNRWCKTNQKNFRIPIPNS
jgi:hypothetical protein